MTLHDNICALIVQRAVISLNFQLLRSRRYSDSRSTAQNKNYSEMRGIVGVAVAVASSGSYGLKPLALSCSLALRCGKKAA